MAFSSEELRQLRQRRDELRGQLAAVGEMRPGSLVGRFRRCGKPGCHCGTAGDRGHGPCWSLTRQVGGKTVTKVIPAGPAVEQTQRQIAEYRRFRNLARQLIEISERLCEVLIDAGEAASSEGAKRGGSTPRSTRKSPARSTRS